MQCAILTNTIEFLLLHQNGATEILSAYSNLLIFWTVTLLIAENNASELQSLDFAINHLFLFFSTRRHLGLL